MRTLQTISLRVKLLLAILSILLVSYSILIYSMFTSVQVFVADEVDKQLLDNLKLVRATTRVRADMTVASLSQPAAASPVRQWLRERNQPLLIDAVKRWHDVLPHLDFLTVVDARHRIIARLNNAPPVGDAHFLTPLLEKSSASLEPIISTELVNSDLLRREGVPEEVIPFVRGSALTLVALIPVKDQNGRLLGWIVAGDVIYADSDYLAATKGLLSHGIVAGISQHGRQVASTTLGVLDELPPEIIDALDRGLIFHGHAKFSNRHYHAISEPLLNLRGELVGALTIAISPERYEFMRHEYERNIILAISVGAILSFYIAYLAARRLTRPLRDLMVGVHNLEIGDLNQQVPVVTTDEIGLLAQAFNRMVAALRERDTTISGKTQALIELNEQLEARVHERTAQLREQARLQEEILASMAEGVVVVNAHDRIVLFNPTARQIFGFDAEMLEGRLFASVCQKGAFCGLREEIGRLLETGGRATVSFASDRMYLKANLSSVQGGEGEIVGVVVSVRDVTIEEAIDRMKTEFIATVSHELKTPLTSMKGSLQYILGKGKWLTGAERELLEICQRNTDRLIRLITSILDISAIEAGGVQFHLTPQVASELVISAIEELRGLALDRNVAVINTVTADLPLILGDHDRLIQVLSNLLSNAIKFAESGKVVKVEARRQGGQLAIAIIDSNRTIAEAERGKLFKKFQQIDQGEGGRLSGSGLGLAISKEIIERHGGQIRHEPIYSGGNEFIITIPLCEEQA